MKNTKKFKFFIHILLIVIVFLTYGLTNYEIAQASTIFPEGSTIGGVDVGGKSSDEVIKLLLTHVEQWKNKAELTIVTNDANIVIPYENIRFDIKSSVEQMEQLVDKPWYAFFSKPKVQHLPLQADIQFPDHLQNQLGPTIDLNETILLVKDVVQYLGDHEIIASFSDKANLKDVVAKETWQVPSDYLLIEQVIKAIDGKTIEPDSTFSILEHVVEPATHYSEPEGNLLASMLYALVLQSDLSIIERHSQGVVPEYTQPGIETKVSKKEHLDFIIKNTSIYPYEISVVLDNDQISMTLLSVEQSKNYEYLLEDSTEVKFQTITRYDKDLRPGHEQVIQKGENGQRINVYRVTKDNNGKEINKELIGREFYLPTPEIVVKGYSPSTAQSNTEQNTSGNSNNTEIPSMINEYLNRANTNNTEEIEGEEEHTDSDENKEQELTEKELLFLLLLLSLMDDKLEFENLPDDINDYINSEEEQNEEEPIIEFERPWNDEDSIYEQPHIEK